MDDLSQKISQILSDPQAIEQLKNITSMMGSQNEGAPKSQPSEPVPAQNGGFDLSKILSDPQTMAQLQGLAGMMGSSEPAPAAQKPVAAPQPAPQAGGLDLTQMLSNPDTMNQLKSMAAMMGMQQPAPSVRAQPAMAAPGGFDLSKMPMESFQMISKLAPLMGMMNQEDETTRLLDALRPFFGPERQKKLAQAEKMLRMMRMLPMLKQVNLF